MSTDLNQLSFAQGSNVLFLESLYEEYLKDPNSLDENWRIFFQGYQLANGGTILGKKGISSDASLVEAFINAYRRLGHLYAHLDPLSQKPEIDLTLQPQSHGLDSIDSSTKFHPANLADIKSASFQEIYDHLRTTYCGYIGADFREINDIEIVTWLQNQMETCKNQPEISKEAKLRILDKLTIADGFEKFLQARFLGQKRFSLEGLDSLIPLLDTIAENATQLNGEEIIMGMAHRGRLNVLVNFIGKNPELLLREFEQSEFIPHDIDGDVKYHLGFMNQWTTSSGKDIRVALLPNPSHLEAINPVVEGFAKSRQRLSNDKNKSKIIPVLIHGDAAFCGQGIVSETLNLAYLPHYVTGGTIHIITNNQIGFTTEPSDYRSSEYSTGIAKVIRAPVLHVNADQPEAVVWCAKLAIAYRQKFNKDIVIDLIGYRRHGHNETDEPSFTQPLMYKKINEHPGVVDLYSNKLIQENILQNEEAKEKKDSVRSQFQQALDKVRSENYQKPKVVVPESFSKIADYTKIEKEQMFVPANTKIDKPLLTKVVNTLTTAPNDVNIHPKLQRLLETRAKSLEGKGNIDWAMAELIAFGSLAVQGHHVRLSGQDCGRGTFSSRQIVWRDINTNERYEPLNQIDAKQESVQVIDSPLSEAGVVGFEFGYSVAEKDSLVLWEAQFGDFCNGAQIIIDQFMAASEAKWKQTSNLVFLLPHGHEGAGPEHSSGRPERFLQLCGNNNMQVAIPTTAAQYFHILRRQVVRKNIYKPLILLTPKSLLRDNNVCSTTDEFINGSFVEILDDSSVNKAKVKKIIFCTGKIYYELFAARENHKNKESIAIIRIEQLYPLHKNLLIEIVKSYKHVDDFVWCQEEPQNMGAWRFIQPRMLNLLGLKLLTYVGRRGSGTTAEGSGKAHQAEQLRILTDALSLGTSADKSVAKKTTAPKSKIIKSKAIKKITKKNKANNSAKKKSPPKKKKKSKT